MDDAKKEFWGDLQVDLHVENTAVYLANQRLENLISTNGKKAHRPALSHPVTGTYTPYSDITFGRKTATEQYLTVDNFEYAADEIDVTDSAQTPYDLINHSSSSIRRGLLNRIEQLYLTEIANAKHTISGGTVELNSTNIFDVLQEAESILGSYDAPYDSAMKVAVFGPQTVAMLRKARGERETRLGDSVQQNGVVGEWNGWTVVQNNNLPYSATLSIATQPTDGDTVVISGVTFTFKTTLGTTAGQVLIGASAATARANLKLAVEGGSGSGTNYIDLSNEDAYLIRRKRYVKCTSAEDMAFTGFGDISVSETLTAAADVWSAQIQTPIFMVRGAIDLVVQFMDIEVTSKEKGFGKLVKGIIGVGTKTFNDGAVWMVKMSMDASNFK